MKPASIAMFTSFISGQKIDAISSIVIDDEGANPAVAAASAVINFKKQPSDAIGDSISTAGGGISLDDGAAWTFSIPEQVLTLTAGTWEWQMHITETDGTERAWLMGTVDVGEKL